MKHLEKPIREIFKDICDDKLTNLEIDDFIKKSSDNYLLSRLKSLIIEYELYIIKERRGFLLYFEYLYLKNSGFEGLYPSRTKDSIDHRIKQKIDDTLKSVHSENDFNKIELNEFSPFLKAFSSGTESLYPEPSDFDSILSSLKFSSSEENEKYSEDSKTKSNSNRESNSSPELDFIHSILSNDSINRNYEAISLFSDKIQSFIRDNKLLDLGNNTEFIKVLELFIDSHVFTFHLNLYAMYKNSILQQTNKHSSTVSEPSVKDETNVSPKNADQSSETVADKPQEDLSPKGIAKSTNSHSYSKEQIEFVMSYAEKCRIYDFTSTIIKEIKEDPNFSKIFKNAPADTTLRRWLDKYDKKNKIKRQIDRVNIKRDTQKK